MKARIGVWIDHKKAVVVTLTDKGEETRQILSTVERQLRRSGDSPLKGSYEALLVPEDNNQQRARTGHLTGYYETVIANLRDAESIWILGPGEAKDELKRQLEKIKLGALIAGVEAADKMTDGQIAAMVRKHFVK